MKRALITGASGFVGRHLASYLQEKGFEIWASAHKRTARFPFRVHWIKADLSRFDDCLQLIRKSKPDFIFHLAAQTVPQEAWKQPAKSFQLNVGVSISLLEAILRLAPKARSLWVSSAQVYGATFLEKVSVREDDVTNPVSPYGGSKLLMEMAVLDFARRHDLSVTIARGTNQVGRGQPETGVFSDFSRRIALIEAKRAAPVLATGNLNVVRDFLPVKDAVRAYYLLALRGKRGECYNVSSGKGIQVREGLRFLVSQSQAPFKIRVLRSRFRKNDFPRMVANPMRLKRLGWRPQENLRRALQELLEEWRGKVSAGLV